MKFAASVALAFVLASGLIEARDVPDAGHHDDVKKLRHRHLYRSGITQRSPNAHRPEEKTARTHSHHDVRAADKEAEPRYDDSGYHRYDQCTTDGECVDGENPFCFISEYGNWCSSHMCTTAEDCADYGENAFCVVEEYGNWCAQHDCFNDSDCVAEYGENNICAADPTYGYNACYWNACDTDADCSEYGPGSSCESDPEYPGSWCNYDYDSYYGRSENDHPRAGEKMERPRTPNARDGVKTPRAPHNHNDVRAGVKTPRTPHNHNDVRAGVKTPRTPHNHHDVRAGVKTPRTPHNHHDVRGQHNRAGVKTPRSDSPMSPNSQGGRQKSRRGGLDKCSTNSDCDERMSPYDPFCIDGWCYYHDCFAASDCDGSQFGSETVCEISVWGNTCCGYFGHDYFCDGHILDYQH